MEKQSVGNLRSDIYAANTSSGKKKITFSEAVLCFYFVLSVFEPYLNGILGSVTKYYIFFTIFVLLFQYRGKIYIAKTSKAIIAWLFYKFISLIWSRDYATPKLHFISQLGMVMFLVILFSYDFEESLLDRIETTYWLSSGIIGFLSMFYSRAYLGSYVSRQVLVIAGVEIDPNNQAALLMIGICVSLVNLFFKKQRRFPSILILLVNTYGCFLTASRAGLATIAAAVLFCVVLPSRKKRISAIIGRVFLSILFFAAAFYLAQKLNTSIYDRLFNFSGYAGGSGRINQWTNVWREYTRNILRVLFGIGWGTSTVTTGAMAQNGTNLGVHNTFLTMLCDVGLLGTLLFMIPIAVMAIRLIKKRIHFPVMLLVIQFIPAFFIDAINKRFFWNAIFILGMYYFHYIVYSKDNIEAAYNYSSGYRGSL